MTSGLLIRYFSGFFRDIQIPSPNDRDPGWPEFRDSRSSQKWEIPIPNSRIGIEGSKKDHSPEPREYCYTSKSTNIYGLYRYWHTYLKWAAGSLQINRVFVWATISSVHNLSEKEEDMDLHMDS